MFPPAQPQPARGITKLPPGCSVLLLLFLLLCPLFGEEGQVNSAQCSINNHLCLQPRPRPFPEIITLKSKEIYKCTLDCIDSPGSRLAQPWSLVSGDHIDYPSRSPGDGAGYLTISHQICDPGAELDRSGLRQDHWRRISIVSIVMQCHNYLCY